MITVIVPERQAVTIWAAHGRVYLCQQGEGEEPDDSVELATPDAVRAVIAALQATLPGGGAS